METDAVFASGVEVGLPCPPLRVVTEVFLVTCPQMKALKAAARDTDFIFKRMTEVGRRMT